MNNDELIYIMSKLQEKTIKYKSQKRLQCALNDDEYYSYILFNYIRNLQQENKELKLELSGYRQAILKDKEMLGLKEENDKLKKQVEELEWNK